MGQKLVLAENWATYCSSHGIDNDKLALSQFFSDVMGINSVYLRLGNAFGLYTMLPFLLLSRMFFTNALLNPPEMLFQGNGKFFVAITFE